jgi:hypothetical protein
MLREFSQASCALALLAATAVGARQDGPAEPQAGPPAGPTDEQCLRAWSCLLPEEQTDLAEWLKAEVEFLGTFQGQLLAFALSLEERDLSLLPAAPKLGFYDPDVHAPGQPIPRRWLEWDDPVAKRERESMLQRIPDSGLRSAWRYDWAAREVQRTGDDRDPGRLFENALRGFLPQTDLAQALLERALDDGAQTKVLAAFAHAYTDRAGTAFPGLTLYDAWGSGKDMEMPDVDILGVVHDVDNQWKRWVAPVPASQHDALYEHVGALFQDARRHRGLRTALAMCYLAGSAKLRDGYAGHLDGLHSLWDAHASTPELVRAQLPDVDHWSEFLEHWGERCDKDRELGAAGVNRRRTLDHDAAQLRALVVGRLTELGALERKQRPKPKPVPAGDGK